MSTIISSIDPLSLSFTPEEGLGIGTAELTEIDIEHANSFLLQPVEGKWLFFNRLYVRLNNRNKGVATNLLEQVCNYADQNEFSIVDCLNPYDDSIDVGRLVKLMNRFDFVDIHHPESNLPIMIRIFTKAFNGYKNAKEVIKLVDTFTSKEDVNIHNYEEWNKFVKMIELTLLPLNRKVCQARWDHLNQKAEERHGIIS